MHLHEEIINKIRQEVRGKILLPGEAEYNQSRKLYNGMIDKHPALIIQCADVADIISCLKFANKENLPVSVKSGGHGFSGHALVDNGLVLDLIRFKGIHIDTNKKTVLVETGCTLADIDHATQPFALAVPSGIFGSTGVGGITLGGGHGYLTRKYGLSIDNLLGASMVLADGSYVNVNKNKYPDLFWAIRGGGGNFGVVTSFLFQLQPAGMEYAGLTLWPLEMAKEVFRFYDHQLKKSGDDLYGFFMFIKIPPVPVFPESLHLRNFCGVFWNFTGPVSDADKIFKPIHEFGPPVFEHIGPIPHNILQTMFDKLNPPGMQLYVKGDFLDKVTDGMINEHIGFCKDIPTSFSFVHFYPVDGAASRFGKSETAWSYRDARWSMVIVGADPDPSGREKIISWCKKYWIALHPFSMGGAYSNFLMDEGQEAIKKSYGINYTRLLEIKKQYDPHNIFRSNYNIT